jgi:hypothetical protein
MGEFNAAVSTLLGAFSSGIAIIKRLRRRRHEEGWPTTNSSIKREEIRLAKSLKRNRADVQTAYTQDLTKFGSRFAEGDCMYLCRTIKSNICITVSRTAFIVSFWLMYNL